MKCLFFLMILLSNSFKVTSQNLEWHLHLDAGLSSIPVLGEDKNLFFEHYTSKPQFSHAYGAFVRLPIQEKLSIEGGLMFLTINDHGHDERDLIFVDINGNQEYFGHSKSVDKLETAYFGIPLILVWKQKKMNFKLGGQINFLMSEKWIAERLITQSDGTVQESSSEIEVQFKDTDYGIVGGFSYTIYKNLGINLRYYHGLQNILDPDDGYPFDIKRPNRQITLGISHYFSNEQE